MEPKITQSKKLLVLVILMMSANLFSQTYRSFNAKPVNNGSYIGLKGDMLLIGNNIMNRSSGATGTSNPYNGTGNNNDFDMQYIDVDGDASTFNSTTADLRIPVATAGCYQIKYAILYWAGAYKSSNVGNQVDRTKLNQVKFKLPGGTYTNLTGTLLYDSFPASISGGPGYVAYQEVTGLLQGLANANGTYGVGNVQCGLGDNTSGGWSLYVVYEDPLSTAKNITLFDGFSNIRNNDPPLDIPIAGFNSIPVGPVRAKLAFAALEGDRSLTGDVLRINGSTMSIPTRTTNNFFNATINDINGAYITRNINSGNLLGFDAGILNVPNAGNSVIANSATNATIRLETGGDSYVYYLNAFAIEVIQPQINLIKTVSDLSGTNVGNQTVNLGQELYYDLSFQNIGNDDAISFTLTDILPVNVSLVSFDLTGAPGVTITSAPGASPIVFSVPNSLVREGGALYKIRIRVRVAENCYDLRDACSNEITNQAFKTYSSLTSGNVVENQQPSASGIDACLFPTPGATNFIADIDDCTFESDEILCGSTITLTAGSGYTSYQWHNGSPPTAGNAISGATNQSYTTSSIGTYSVVNTAPAPCLSITETFNVIDFDSTITNPVLPYADQIDICANDGTEFPKIFLCGANDSQLIQTNILNASSIVWEQLVSCPTPVSPDQTPPNTCPKTDLPNTGPCTWTSVGSGPNFNATAAGEFRVTITYQNGCTKKFYFNVYKNSFTPTVTATDIICTTPGTITVNGVPNGYEFSINGVDFFPNNVFNVTTGGVYTVYTQEIGGSVGSCLFTIPNVSIIDRNFEVVVSVDDALCYGDKGEIRVQVNNVDPQYTYELLLGSTSVITVGPIDENDYTFSNLNPGTYTLNVSTSDGCSYTQTITISDPPLLTLTGAVTIPLTCTDGEITLYPVGGTPLSTGGYIYTLSGDSTAYTSPNFVITTPGTYNFTVTDNNNCTASTSVTINSIPAPVFTVSQTNILCYGQATGEIVFNVTNTNGYTLAYSINNGGNFSPNPVFSNLPAGTYQTQVQYSLNGSVCTTTAQTITITQPALALTASAGVSELAGCGPTGEGKVRITNPQGGTAPYEYSFNGGVNYIAANEAYLAPGTYTVCIRDANLCTFCSSVTIDPAPQDPTITVAEPDYNCDGTATTTVTVNNNGGNFEYSYYIDNVLNTNVPPNVFVNVPCGPHDIKVQFENLIIPTYSNLLFEDFGIGGNTTTSGIAAAYCWNNQPYPASTTCGNNTIPGYAPVCGSYTIEDNQYDVTSAIIPNNCNWFPYRDHTSNGTNPNGRFLAVNIGSAAGNYGILYSKPINNVLPNQPVLIDLYLANLLNAGVAGADPDFILELVDPSGTVVASQATGIIDNVTDGWQLKSLSLNPGNNTALTFNIRSGSILYSGNDAAIDDINVYQEPIVCIDETIFPILVDCNQAFSAQITSASDVSCNGANDGQITIAAQNFVGQFYYSTTGGAPFTSSTNSPVTITGLAAGTYNVVIQYDLSSTPCSFPFTQTIGQPTALVANAVLTSPATCLVGGVITASASGGTPNYQYELQNGIGGILIPFQSNPVFSSLVPGDYIVVIKDALGCTDPIDTVINIPVPTPPTAVIDVTSDLCYDGVNAATIVVTASGGVGPYVYSLNGGTPQSSNTFSGLTPGNYNIVVTDSYGCTVTIPTVTIAPQLLASAVLTSGLDCTATPDAAINVTINGGTAPYTYQVSFNSGALSTPPTAVTGTTFTYTTSNPGTYQFTITDAIGCTVVTNTVTVIPLPVLNVPVLTQTAFNLCNGDSNGAISVAASGGLTPYTYSIDGSPFQFGNTFTGLIAGNHTVTVMDANSCTQTATITLIQPDPIAFTIVKTDIQCGASGTQPGSIDVINVTGGTPSFIYNIYNSTRSYSDTFVAVTGEDHSFPILNFGIYTVEVVDANGCVLVQNNISIASPPNSLNIDITTPTADCTAGGIIKVCVNPAVVGGPYHFAIYQDLAPANPPYPTYPSTGYQDADVTDPTGLCSTFINLIPGVTYSFIVYDETTNCYYFETASGPVPTPSMITSTITPHNVTCTGASDGSVSFTISGYSGTSVSYQVYQSLNNTPVGSIGTSNGLSGSPFTVNNFGVLPPPGLPPGQYFVLFTENDGTNTGCSQTSADFTISQSPVLLSLTAAVTHNDNCNVNAGQITVTGSNGTPPYTYQIVTVGGPAPAIWPGQSSNVFNVEGGSYDVYIQDANGCIQPFTNVFVPTDTAPNITLTLDATTLCNQNEGSYTIIVTRDTTVGIAPFTYSVDGATFATFAGNPFSITNLNSGTHTVIIKDANGCTETETITINPPLNGTLTPTIAAVQNCGVSDGIITVNAAGGSGSYTYSIAPPNALIVQSTNVFSNVPAGTYTITITDAVTNCFITSSVTLATPTVPSFTSSVIDATCNGDSNGSITITLTGSNPDPVYTYEITAGPITFAPQTTNVFNGLPTGTYTVVVTSGRGCTTTQDIVVGEPAPIVVPSPTVTQFACNAGTNTVNNASIVVSGVTGGSGTYINYVFINSATNVTVQSGTNATYLESNPAGGTYTINVYDNNGCLGTTTGTIDPFVRISNPSVTVTNPITCVTDEEIVINVTTTGGTPASLVYTVTGLGTNTYNVTQVDNPNFTGLTIGNYNITILNPTTGCSVETIHYVFDPNTFVVNATVNSNVTCYNAGTGSSVTINFVDLVAPPDNAGSFDYIVINNGTGLQVASGFSPSTTLVLNDLPAGSYQFEGTLSGLPTCPAVTNFTITQPSAALTITTSSTPVTCDPNSGTISAVGHDGWGGPYEYQLELVGTGVLYPWSSNAYFENLGPGNYIVGVKDIIGCEVYDNTISFTVPTPLDATLTPSTTFLPCIGDNTATLTVSVSGGYGSGYLYVLNTVGGTSTAPQTSNVFTNLGAGEYSVTVSDSFNCSDTFGTVIIDEPTSAVESLLTVFTRQGCTSPAVLQLSASGGTADYYYSTTSGGPYTLLVGGSVNIPLTTFVTVPTDFTYYVVDANNCREVYSTITVTPLDLINIELDLTNATISCTYTNQPTDPASDFATVIATATGGVGNYIFTFNPPTAGVTQTVLSGNEVRFDNIPAGTNYTISVNSGPDCQDAESFDIVAPTEIFIPTPSVTQISCPGLVIDDATISVFPTGGTPPYQYNISLYPFEYVDSNVFTYLGPGVYTITVQDANGCIKEVQATIDTNEDFGFTILDVKDAICIEDNGSVELQITGGTDTGGSNTTTEGYNLTFGGNTYNSLNGYFNFPSLAPGEYTFTFTDDNYCSYIYTFEIMSGIDIDAQPNAYYECIVDDVIQVNVIIDYNENLAIDDLTFDIDNGTLVQSGVGGNEFFDTGLANGTHTVTVTYVDPIDNTITCQVTKQFVVNAPIPLNLDVNETGLNQFTMVASGGTPPYIFSVDGVYYGQGNSLVYFVNHTATYLVTVTDANGCIVTIPFPITFYDVEIPDSFTPNNDGTNDGWSPQYLDNFPNAVTYVFDRYSRKIITLRPGQTWNGTYNGNELPSGDYWYVLKLNGESDAREFVGNFTLYR